MMAGTLRRERAPSPCAGAPPPSGSGDRTLRIDELALVPGARVDAGEAETHTAIPHPAQSGTPPPVFSTAEQHPKAGRVSAAVPLLRLTVPFVVVVGVLIGGYLLIADRDLSVHRGPAELAAPQADMAPRPSPAPPPVVARPAASPPPAASSAAPAPSRGWAPAAAKTSEPVPQPTAARASSKPSSASPLPSRGATPPAAGFRRNARSARCCRPPACDGIAAGASTFRHRANSSPIERIGSTRRRDSR